MEKDLGNSRDTYATKDEISGHLVKKISDEIKQACDGSKSGKCKCR